MKKEDENLTKTDVFSGLKNNKPELNDAKGSPKINQLAKQLSKNGILRHNSPCVDTKRDSQEEKANSKLNKKLSGFLDKIKEVKENLVDLANNIHTTEQIEIAKSPKITVSHRKNSKAAYEQLNANADVYQKEQMLQQWRQSLLDWQSNLEKEQQRVVEKEQKAKNLEKVVQEKYLEVEKNMQENRDMVKKIDQRLIELDNKLKTAKEEQIKVLVNYASKKDIVSIQLKLNSGWDPNLRDSTGQTLLHHAVLNKDIKLLKLLLQKHPAGKGNPNIADNSGKIPLHLAVLQGEVNLILALLYSDEKTCISNALTMDKTGKKPIEYLNVKMTEQLKEMLINAEHEAEQIYENVSHSVDAELAALTKQKIQFREDMLCSHKVSFGEELSVGGYTKKMTDNMLKEINNTILLPQQKQVLMDKVNKAYQENVIEDSVKQITKTKTLVSTFSSQPNTHLKYKLSESTSKRYHSKQTFS